MEQNEHYMTIYELAQNLIDFANKIEEETIDKDGILEMTEISRELYERLVVIRYSALSEQSKIVSKVEVETEVETKEENAVPPFNQDVDAAPEEDIDDYESSIPEPEEGISQVNESSFRLDISDANPISPNQISLIDSIEEIKNMEKSLNDKFSSPQEISTLGKKLQKSPIKDLKSALSINQRFVFISELFNGDAELFEQSVERLNNFNSFIEADEFVQNNLRKQLDWESKDSNVISFLNLVERRYI